MLAQSLTPGSNGASARAAQARATRRWGIAALAAWLLFALDASGAPVFATLSPGALAACAARGHDLRTSPIPSEISPGLRLARGREQIELPVGTLLRFEGGVFRLVGADFPAARIVVEDQFGLLSVPLERGTLFVRPLRKGGRIGAVVASGIAGLAGGMAGGLATGFKVSSGFEGGFVGCIVGGSAGAALGVGTTLALTRERVYPLGPGHWQVLPPVAREGGR